ncbi:MAG TPA: hypothetical protein VMV72_15985 [Verrucomicrobiae bacterium]|nr:hypothetical protein [Verrucomicrobiae bacterium]
MRNALLSSVLAVIGLMVCWNAPIAIAADEGTDQQAAHHEAGLVPPGQPPDVVVKPVPVVRVLWPGIDMKQEIRCVLGVLKGVLLVWAVCNILLASWIYTDIRKLGQGHGIFVALALLAGFPAAILYAVVRIGDKKA